MVGFINDLAARHNLSMDKTQAWGFISGFWFQLTPPAYGRNFLRILTAVNCPDEAALHAVAGEVEALVMSTPSLSYHLEGGSLTLERKVAFGSVRTDEVESLFLRLTAIFKKAGAAPACFHCNTDRTDSFASVNGTAMRLCAQCQADMERSAIQGNEEQRAAKNNFLLGLLGAVLGAVAGSVVWVVIGLLGRLAALGGLAISFCAIKGFTLMKGRISRPALVVICLISLAVMVLAQFITFDILIYQEFQKAGEAIDFGTVLMHTFELPFMDSEVTGGFVRDCALGVLFVVLGSYPVIKPLFANARTPAGKFERL